MAFEAVAGPSSQPETSSTSSFRDFAASLADARELTLADRLASASSDDPTPIVGTALRFAQVCSQHAATAQGEDTDFRDADGGRISWILEARTWELIHLVCADRYLYHPESSEGDSTAKLSRTYYQTPLAAIQDILEDSRPLRELKIIREWLSSQLPPVHVAEVRKGYMPFSKNRLKAEKRTSVGTNARTGSQKNVVRNLDPDAEFRGEGKWDMEDANYAKALHRTLFEYTRAGELEAAFDLARQADQPWRAASLRGAMLFHQSLGADRGDDEMDELDQVAGATGNRNRALWKAVCRKLSSNGSLDPFEKALYGSLSGQLQPVLAVSESWEEHLWAYVNSTFEEQIDQAFEEEDLRSWWSQEGGGNGAVKVVELKVTTATKSSRTTAVNTPTEAHSQLKDIFERLRGTEKAGVHLEATNPFRIAQGAVILDEINDLLVHVEGRLDDMQLTIEPKQYAHLLRFFSHLVLYLRLLDRPLPASTCNSILRHYVEVLETAGEDELVAMYASSLEKESAEESYAHFLKSFSTNTSSADRKTALYRAKEHSLDIASVARLVVQIIFAESYPAIVALDTPSVDPIQALQLDLTETEARLISAIDWLTFNEETSADAIFQSNALMRLFLSSGKIHAARVLLQNLPDHLLADLENLSGLTYGDKTEYVHYRHFFDALAGNVRFSEIFANRPTAASAGSVSKMELHSWREALGNVVSTAKTALLEVLTTDWLKLDADEQEEEQTSQRLLELARIRQLYIPELVLRLHFMLFDTRDVLSDSLPYVCEDLPVLVADERHKLYLEFVTKEGGNRLREYLEFVRTAKVESLE